VLIGSWCVVFYKDYFVSVPYIDYTGLRTRDVDFLISMPDKIKHAVDIPAMLKDLGFVTIFRGAKGYIKLDHPDLIVEFLVPEKGKGTDRPYPLPKLGVNAVALRFLNFLCENTIKIKVEDFYLTLPHPANFSLHKFIISKRRVEKNKAMKDANTAIKILKALISKGEGNIVNNVFRSTPRNWQKRIIRGLQEAKGKEILSILELKD
jgi:hypothetical protein